MTTPWTTGNDNQANRMITRDLSKSDVIDRCDLYPILQPYAGSERLADTLLRTESPENLLIALGRYIQFNSIFAAGVAALTGHIAARIDLFQDMDEAAETLADRSALVAAHIFSAAIDEFGDRGTGSRVTHRTLAQATLKATGLFFGYSDEDLDRIIRVNDPTRTAIAKVAAGYGINRRMEERALFNGIGFHLSSELLAQDEFLIIEDFLRHHWPDLVKFLSENQMTIGDIQCPSYLWLCVHSRVEAEHFDLAVSSAVLALRYYSGRHGRATIRHWILEGFGMFASLQADLMRGLI